MTLFTTSRPACVVGALLLSLPSLAAAQRRPQQPSGSAQQDSLRARYAAHEKEFDYLIGEWSFVQTRRATATSPAATQRGTWRVTRSPDGAILTDVFRIVDDSGRTRYVSTTLRAYSAVEDRWNLVGVEPGSGLHMGVAWKEGDDMRVDQEFGSGASTSKWRIRYHDIRPDAFSWRADVSRDGGKTWVEGYSTIEAKRTTGKR